ncbi:MAG: glycosyltransferase family 2 protein [Candidatus Omnitrophica bacterium]|nr:glycosyltransferase family 2 protein [Candidatus Omnitrophota bacterium]
MKSKRIKLSSCIIALNEEKNIGKVIKNVKPYVNEVVVIDGGSKDKTVKIAEKAGAKVYRRKFDGNFGAQRNYAIEKARGEWIFFIDADERASKELLKSLRKFIRTKKYDCFGITRKNYINGKLNLVEYNKLNLFKRYGYYDRPLHEIVRGVKNIKTIKNPKIYISHYKTSREQKKHNRRYQKILNKLYRKYYRQNEKKKLNLIKKLKKEEAEHEKFFQESLKTLKKDEEQK